MADCFACHTDHEGPDPANATKPFAHETLASDVRDRGWSLDSATLPDGVYEIRVTASAAVILATRLR